MARRRRRSPLWTVLGLVVLAAAGLAAALIWNTRVWRAGSMARVTIPAGATVQVAADSLAATRVIRSALVFRIAATLRGEAGAALVSGRYLVPRGAGVSEVLAQLVSGRGRFHRLLVREGWSVQQIARLAADSLGIPADSIIAAARDSARRARMKTPVGDVEGYLFPATYDFADGVTAGGVVDTMLMTFERRWKPAWDSVLAQQGRSRHALVTLASIVEKEAGRDSDRPLIAAVYLNRLAAGMRLQADPTVIYGMGLVSKKRVMFADLRTESPYNTYRVSGLPPGPIASPGTASLQAALSPAKSDAMFFVAHPDGHSEFTRTFAQHTAAVKAARAARDSAAPRR
jgi:UPF0755 protein